MTMVVIDILCLSQGARMTGVQLMYALPSHDGAKVISTGWLWLMPSTACMIASKQAKFIGVLCDKIPCQ